MPCVNHIGYLELELDQQDRLIGFSLTKFNCSLPPGGITLLPYLKNTPARSIIDGTLGDFIPSKLSLTPAISTLLEKQFLSLQTALSIYLGGEQDIAGLSFSLKSVNHDASSTHLDGYITLGTTWENILGCGGCRGGDFRRG
jgi:hypothetical protein